MWLNSPESSIAYCVSTTQGSAGVVGCVCLCTLEHVSWHGRGGAGGVWSVGRPVNHHPPELSLVSQSRRAASQMLPKPAFVVNGVDTKNCFLFIIFDNSRKYTGTTFSTTRV